MSHTQKAVRYYIDRDADTPVVRSVPVARPQRPTHHPHHRPALENLQHGDTNLAASHAADESRRRGARNRLASLVKATVKRHHQHQS